MTDRQRVTSSAVEVDRPSRRLTGREPVSLRHSNVGHTFGVRHDTRVDTLQQGGALRLARHLLRHEARGQRRNSTLRLGQRPRA